ncbi:hypothetical protein NUU61_000984 [Penicillium alfredii]|uniref:Uncharacterized protein n=1 Tax=Penicillium alfredii TaxID=1506179 RepID=A0A9W9GAK8_9EURO|nr:uncharacterized protein NUU61_000984 [Penicillium alfredii]KAJ5115225.1 hypothetical protein NUU61_000984 [Penicillium alfredii]
MKLNLALTVLVSTGTLAAAQKGYGFDCFASGATKGVKYAIVDCTPLDGGHKGTPTNNGDSDIWCYLKGSESATSPLECGAGDGELSNPTCLTKDDDPKLGGCGPSGS